MVIAIWLASESRPLFWGKTLLGTTKVQHAHSRAPCPGQLYRGFIHGADEPLEMAETDATVLICSLEALSCRLR